MVSTHTIITVDLSLIYIHDLVSHGNLKHGLSMYDLVSIGNGGANTLAMQ